MHLRIPRLQKRRLLPIQTIPGRIRRPIQRITRPPPGPRPRKPPASALHHDLRHAVLLSLSLLLRLPVPAALTPTPRPLPRRARRPRRHHTPLRLPAGEPFGRADLLRGPSITTASNRLLLLLGRPPANAQQRAERRELGAAARRGGRGARSRGVGGRRARPRLVALGHGLAHAHADGQQRGLDAGGEGGSGGGRRAGVRWWRGGRAPREDAVDWGLEGPLAGVHCGLGVVVVLVVVVWR